MQLSFAAPGAIGSGAFVVAAYDGGKLSGAAQEADKETGGAITRAIGFSRFSGKSGQVVEVLAPAGIKASRLIVVGLGTPEGCDGSRLESAAAAVYQRLNRAGETEITFRLDAPKGAKLKPARAAAHVAFGARLQNYAFNHYRTKNLDEHQIGRAH